jgi:hypothetical protein
MMPRLKHNHQGGSQPGALRATLDRMIPHSSASLTKDNIAHG